MSVDPVVHLIDDDEDVRRALAFLLGTAGMTVRLYDSALSFLGSQDAVQRGCIVSDVRMPGMDGLELLRQLRSKGASLPVIIMTGHADVPLAVEAMKAGAADFIEKPFSDEALLSSVRLALGRSETLGEADSERKRVRARLAALSERERQVLDGLVAGHPNKTIAHDLGISPRTVEVHRANLMTKMGASSLSALIRMALVGGDGP